MGFLLRVAVVVVIFGLILGAVFRRAAPERWAQAVLLSLLPWLLHLLYALFHAATVYQSVLPAIVFVLLDLVLVVIILRVAPRFYRQQSRLLAAVPALVLALHSLLLWLWTQVAPVSFSLFPNVIYFMATLFAIAALYLYGSPIARTLVRRP